jgi:hypothetical protein
MPFIGFEPMCRGHLNLEGLSARKKEDLIVFNIKALAMATAVSAGVVFAMPVASQAMPASSPVKVQTSNDSNIVDVRYKKRWNRWARYCAYNYDDWRCHRRHYTRYYRYRYYDDEPYYGYYRPYRHHYGPGVGLQFRID